MLLAASEAGSSGAGITTVLVVVLVLGLASRHEKKAAATGRAKRKAEIEAIVKSRPGDVDLFREVLDELKAKDAKGKPT